MAMNRVEIDGIEVDVEELQGVRFACEPELCKKGPNCCTCYEVRVSDARVERIVGLMPHVVRFKPALRDGDGYAAPFEEGEKGEQVIDEDEDGRCAFAYSGQGGAIWCAVHSAALAVGVDPWEWKPRECLQWPVAVSEDAVPVLGIQEDAQEFPCVRSRRKGAKGLDAGIREILVRLYGEAFAAAVERAAGG